MDVDKGRDGLDRACVLRMVNKVTKAYRKLGIPVEDVELRLLKRLVVHKRATMCQLLCY